MCAYARAANDTYVLNVSTAYVVNVLLRTCCMAVLWIQSYISELSHLPPPPPSVFVAWITSPFFLSRSLFLSPSLHSVCLCLLFMLLFLLPSMTFCLSLSLPL